MARLRVRIELNRGGVGIPLHKLSSVVEEAQKFFQMVAQDVHIEKNQGEWLAFDFDNGSLNFTAEYVGPVSAEQVRAFYAAFDGVTSLRRATIYQFTRIANAIGEDELIGFGLYQSDQEAEPSEWRCLSRRNALRIADEIQLLEGVAGELEQESHLPAAIDSEAGAKLFKQRYDRGGIAAASDQAKWAGFVRAVESNLGNRISRLEGQVETHSGMIRDLRESSAIAEESFRNLLTTVEKFCGQATRELERVAPRAQTPLLAAPAAPPPTVSRGSSRRSYRALIASVIVVAGVSIAGFLFWPPRQSEPAEPKAAASDSGAAPNASPAESNAPQRAQAPEPPPLPNAGPMHIDLEARQPTWVSITDADGNALMARVLQPNETRTFELTKGATLRTGNAGALILRFNGKDVGTLGPEGKIRDIDFNNGTFKIRAPNSADGVAAEGAQDNPGNAVNHNAQHTDQIN